MSFALAEDLSVRAEVSVGFSVCVCAREKCAAVSAFVSVKPLEGQRAFILLANKNNTKWIQD